jgi:peptidoglycan/xylan/chitin deacetylase (PgdA/CDA1 family)
MEEMQAAGHTIGNHTMRHENGNKTSKIDYLNSIEEASPFTSTTLFRPPYGRLPIHYIKPIRSKYKIIMWSWLSYDYDHSVSVDKVLSEAQKIKAGDILVLHDNAKVEERIKIILPKLIQLLKAKDFKFEKFKVQ